ncbi:hypothetical protein QBC32DRAFT_95523 [Pseudoneurospora amorphoporcata]|uniref:Calponin-homology (CH) domain-containing protein n=1 Tax=Pseudoneurospora amorphoporcata TaxID=241081 RepID=A0AAN6P214_9PEZI|nr:hypothetical protein QBC32DRAFT_95523 [Pseudoneurospora amorphoporcata]
MASVTSLDKDLRKLRAEKYTPQAAGEAKAWIESVLGEKLPQPDLLDALKDGVALCKLVNKVLPPPGVKFKQSAMPFVQMENISIFLRSCKAPPLNLLEHDVFLTVDLYERKDPAQVLQCIGAFSRAANAANPSAVPTVIGPKNNAHNTKSVVSPQATGGAPLKSPDLPARNTSTASNATVSSFSSSFGSSLQPTASPLVAQKTGGSVSSSRWGAKSPTLSATTPSVSGSVSSWSNKNHEGTTSPAWNIAQYGYMGGASQGTMGVSFGGRRQITTAAPNVPSVQEKERKRKEAEVEAERKRKEEEQRKKAEQEAAEERARQEEERRWEVETRKAREEERRKLEEEKRRWQEEERQWKLDQEKRRKEEEEAERRLQAELKQEEEKKRAAEKQIQNQAQAQAQHGRERSDPRLRGQLLSQYQAEESRDKERIRELERELEKARRREAEYERERQERSRRLGVSSGDDSDEKQRSRSRPARPISRQDSWKPRDERRFSSRPPSPLVQDILDGYLDSPVQPAAGSRSPRPLPDPTSPSRPLPIPANPMLSPPQKLTTQRTGGANGKENNGNGLSPALPIRPNHTGNSRPLPNPHAAGTSPLQTRGQQPVTPTQPHGSKSPFNKPRSPYSPTRKAGGGFAALSLLEREMELERQRQREWEEAQQETAKAVRADEGVNGIGGGIGGRWDVGQWAGFTGGDSQNRGSQGIGAGRRPIVGPRPLPNLPQ